MEYFDIDTGFGSVPRKQAKLTGQCLLQSPDEYVSLLDDSDSRRLDRLTGCATALKEEGRTRAASNPGFAALNAHPGVT